MPNTSEPETLIERLGVLVESRVVRTVLVVLIIASVLPFHEIETTFRGLFLAAFGAELAVRIPLLIRRRQRRDVSLGVLLFLIIDIAAFVSFLPLDEWFARQFDFLTFMRLSRLLVLLRFAKELANDLYSILTRREQLQQFGLVTVAVAALAFVSAVVLSQLGVSYDYDGAIGERETFWDQLWWSFRQLESPDNLVSNLHVHPLLGVLSLALTITGVFIISYVIGIGANVVDQVVRAERRRDVGYRGHTVVVGPIEESQVLVREFVRIYSKNRRDFRDQMGKIVRWLIRGAAAPRAWKLPRMALLGPSPEPPPVLFERGMRWVVYREGDGSERKSLRRIGASDAKRAILLGDRAAGADADAITVATLAAFRELNPDAHVFLELLTSRNFTTLHTLGEGTRTFLLDVPWFLGLFMLHHLVIPGVERLYRYLLTTEGSELYSHVYLEDSELEGLAALADEDGYVSSEQLARLAEKHRAILVGVFLGETSVVAGSYDLISTEGLIMWVNPHAEPSDERLLELGAKEGLIPAAHIRGVIGVAETYQPLRSFARALADEPDFEEDDSVPPAVTLDEPVEAPKRILIVGHGDAIASFTHRLGQLTEGASVVVAMDDDAEYIRRLEGAVQRVGGQLEAAGERYTAELEGGGKLELRAGPGDAMDIALSVLQEDVPIDAVVFLAEADAKDPDARTTLRMMRLAEYFLNSERKPPHVLAELSSLAKGERARLQVELAFLRLDREPPRLTLVSTEQVRNYFMVHSAFVPGINDVYRQLLGERGQDLIRKPVNSDEPLKMSAVRRLVAEEGCCVALGFELEDGEVLLNPPPERAYDDVVAVFAIGPST